MPERVDRFHMSEDVWRALVFALSSKGWHSSIGGGLDHSWAVLERDGMRIEMEYDIWGQGELIMAVGDVAQLAADLPANLIAELGLSSSGKKP